MRQEKEHNKTMQKVRTLTTEMIKHMIMNA